jgi:hypothetical protein
VLKGANLYPQTDAPTFSRRGGSISPTTPVTMATNADKIYYTVDGTDPRMIGGAPNPIARVASFGGGGPTPVTYMNTGYVWKYLDNGSDQGTAWRAVGFNDSAWASGPSSLGYGTEGEGAGTTVAFGPDANNRYRTTYFRTTVQIPTPGTFDHFLLQIKYDDAAAVYINGAEIVRTPNLPANAAYSALATAGVADETTWKDYNVPVSVFNAGTNTVAVEIHQATNNSSDIRLDMFLRGEVSSGGSNVTDPLFFTQPTLVKARAFNSGTGVWSPIDEVFFSIDTVPADSTNLVIAEFSYRPGAATAAESVASTDPDDFEFIELLNIGSRTIDLTGLSFVSGLSFTFPDNTLLAPGSRIVVAKNRLAFNVRYSALLGSIALAGEFASGSLSNDGERIILTSLKTGVVRDFTYDDQAPWPNAPDGDGFSLVLIAPRTNPDPGVAANWRSSTLRHGNPGTTDAVSYEQWKSMHGVIRDTDDPDNDGLTQFAEFSFGTPPDVHSEMPITSHIITLNGEAYAAIDIQRSLAAADDVRLLVETSPNLVQWTANAVYVGETRSADGAIAIVTYRAPAPVSASARVFLRATFVLR